MKLCHLTGSLPDVGLTLARRRRRRAYVKQTSGKRGMFAGTWKYNLKVSSCSTANIYTEVPSSISHELPVQLTSGRTDQICIGLQ